jgi:hypothetical protein
MKRTASQAALLPVVLSALLAGCGTPPPKVDRPAPSNERESGIGVYLETLRLLADSERAQQADLFYEIERAYVGSPTTATTLRFAAALVTPGHPSSNLAEGRKLLAQLLASPERLLPPERQLAAFLAKDADARLELEAEIRRLAATVDERTRRQANSDRRVQTLTDELARLKRELEEAQRKLDAIKSIEIERSRIERNTSPPAPRDPAGRN